MNFWDGIMGIMQAKNLKTALSIFSLRIVVVVLILWKSFVSPVKLHKMQKCWIHFFGLNGELENEMRQQATNS